MSAVVLVAWSGRSGAKTGEAEGPASFEVALASAQPAPRLADLIEPLVASCDGPATPDLAARQCRVMRGFLVDQLRGATYVGLGDAAALQIAPSPSGKSVDLAIVGCLACARPVVVASAPRLVATRATRSMPAGGRAVGLEVGHHAIAVADSAAAARFASQVGPRLQVQFVFRLGAIWKTPADGGPSGVTFVPIAHRVIDPCTGRVLASEPRSLGDAAVATTDGAYPSCPKPGSELSPEEQIKITERAELPDQLSRQQIEASLAPVQAKLHDCYAEFEQAGTAAVRFIVDGDGRVGSIAVLPPFDKTPTGYCIRTAMKTAILPPFKGDKMTITFPFYLR